LGPQLQTGISLDAFQPYPGDTPEWTDAVWFAAYVPEQALTAYVYQWFRPALGIYGGGCIVWERTAAVPWDAALFQYDVNRPITGALRLEALSLDNGTSITSLREGCEYRVRFENARALLEFRFESLTTPHVTTRGAAGDFFAGHLDQGGWCTGSIEIEGRRHAIDAYGIRDRSWGPRIIRDDVRLGYFHGGSRRRCFLGFCHSGQTSQPVFNGYLSVDGQREPVNRGERRVQYRGERLERITFDIEDAAGRSLHASGVPLNEFAYTPYPNLLSRHYLMRWDIGGEVAYGEEQDLWSVPLWREHRRARSGILGAAE
jgi:hypothetical protein